MNLQGIITFAHDLLERASSANDVVVDATCGNGNDTLFLSKLVGSKGHVYAFDIQARAIKPPKAVLAEETRDNVTLIHHSHALLDQYIDQKQMITAAV